MQVGLTNLGHWAPHGTTNRYILPFITHIFDGLYMLIPTIYGKMGG